MRQWADEGSSPQIISEVLMRRARDLVPKEDNKYLLDEVLWNGLEFENFRSLEKDIKEAEKRHMEHRWPFLTKGKDKQGNDKKGNGKKVKEESIILCDDHGYEHIQAEINHLWEIPVNEQVKEETSAW
jgi:hypothetical protein